MSRCANYRDQWGDKLEHWVDAGEEVSGAGVVDACGGCRWGMCQALACCRRRRHQARCQASCAATTRAGMLLLRSSVLPQVIKAGLKQFPESAFLHILYSSFLIEHRKQQQVGGGVGG